MAAGDACISFQVVQECLNIVPRKARVAPQAEQARIYLGTVLRPLLQASSSPPLYHRAPDMRARYRLNFYDSLIVTGALAACCSRLFSEDLRHGQRVERLTIIDPFQHIASKAVPARS